MNNTAARTKVERLSPPVLGNVLEFMRVIWQLDHALHRTSKRMASRLGVTGPQRLVIRIVGRFPDIPAGRLAELLHLHPSTLTGILKRLERQGMLRRRADPQDARRSLLTLSDKGRTVNVDAGGSVEACVARALRRTPPEKLAAARAVLAEIATKLAESVSDDEEPIRITRAPRRPASSGRGRSAASR
jgi:DNA-binding MarR family transcriptional regulator